LSYFFDFKIILAFIISFGIAYIIGPMLLPMLKKLKFGQTIREDGPASHLVKNGTPNNGWNYFYYFCCAYCDNIR
jgi:Phospho-N-acetylmuramoyl-pentapeptide-transferase (EC 2.7.8.13)